MSNVVKYENIETELPKLPEVLLNTIQSECLEISSIDKECKKYIKTCEKIPELTQAEYVVYSKYIKKENHKYEKFLFLNSEGEEVCAVSGTEMELYGILHACDNLYESEEYKHTHK